MIDCKIVSLYYPLIHYSNYTNFGLLVKHNLSWVAHTIFGGRWKVHLHNGLLGFLTLSCMFQKLMCRVLTICVQNLNECVRS